MQHRSYPQIRKLLEEGQLTCMELVRNHLAVIHQKNHLNAFLSIYENEAIARARDIDQKIKNQTAGKLAGLVVGIKDLLCYKDHPLQGSSKILNGFISQYNATAVQRLLDADAIIIGRQNCDEFGMGSSNENSAFGSVRNDLDNNRVSGGSSGGSAVAVQAGMCQISLGTDTGGSVRQPAAFCGLLGLKPTYSRISRYGLAAYASSFDCIGILANYVEDIALVLEVIAGADEMDSTVSRKEVPSYATELNIHKKKFKIAYFRENIENPSLQEEIKSIFTETIQNLKSDQHVVEPIDFPWNEYVLPTYYILATAEASSNLSRYDGVRYGYRSPQTKDLSTLYKKTRSEGFGREVQRRIMLGTFVLSASYYDAYYTKAQKVRRLIRDQVKEIFSHYDFILMPTTPTTAFKIGTHSSDPVEMYLADLFSVQANVAGVPAISLPCGIDKQGLPVGLQLLADDFEECKLLKFSKMILDQRQH
ncbi:MAG: Asp-tRNA(Asn)/Glu-tRNA(Gln) amidotransferase subunit GatA [Bacteroidetes bacterium]|nr:Asp-tRNA(Asn)/Glu-tRNA(Gln) amidotransferase subunit GatA [Bacteroidota bacterium]